MLLCDKRFNDSVLNAVRNLACSLDYIHSDTVARIIHSSTAGVVESILVERDLVWDTADAEISGRSMPRLPNYQMVYLLTLDLVRVQIYLLCLLSRNSPF